MGHRPENGDFLSSPDKKMSYEMKWGLILLTIAFLWMVGGAIYIDSFPEGKEQQEALGVMMGVTLVGAMGLTAITGIIGMAWESYEDWKRRKSGEPTDGVRLWMLNPGVPSDVIQKEFKRK